MKVSEGEILDEIMTRSRGEIRHTHSPKASSSTPNIHGDIRLADSPHMRRMHSPRLNELRGERSLGGSPSKEMMQLKRTPSPKPLNLAKDTYHDSPSS